MAKLCPEEVCRLYIKTYFNPNVLLFLGFGFEIIEMLIDHLSCIDTLKGKGSKYDGCCGKVHKRTAKVSRNF